MVFNHLSRFPVAFDSVICRLFSIRIVNSRIKGDFRMIDWLKRESFYPFFSAFPPSLFFGFLRFFCFSSRFFLGFQNACQCFVVWQRRLEVLMLIYRVDSIVISDALLCDCGILGGFFRLLWRRKHGHRHGHDACKSDDSESAVKGICLFCSSGQSPFFV